MFADFFFFFFQKKKYGKYAPVLPKIWVKTKIEKKKVANK